MGDVRRFYEGRTVFMTGTSGFLGQIALEKLLRACDVRRIYVLLRAKKDKEPLKRLEDLFAGVAFERLNRQCPEFRKKVSLILGDCKEPNLGMSAEDVRLLQEEVEVVIHWAATVRFDENLKTATYINVRSVRDLLTIARQMPKLKAFIHCSTAFSHCVRSEIDEVFYDPPMSGQRLIAAMEALDEELVSQITPQFLGEWPNTYVYTKAVGEDLVRTEGKGLPVAVFRPSVVLSSFNEPVPGWVDNLYGATGLMVGVAIGLIRVIRCQKYNKSNLVPADYVVNSAITTAWDVNRRCVEAGDSFKEQTTPPPVYNFVSSPENSLTWPDFIAYAHKHSTRIPSPLIVWNYVLFLISNRYIHKLSIFLFHYLPAYVVDFIAICIGKKPQLVKGYKKIHKFTGVVEYFCMRQWQFGNDNVAALWGRLSDADREGFQFDMSALDWDAYFAKYTVGCRLYLLKDPLDTVPQGRKKIFRMKVLHYVVCGLVLLGLYKLSTWMLSLFVRL